MKSLSVAVVVLLLVLSLHCEESVVEGKRCHFGQGFCTSYRDCRNLGGRPAGTLVCGFKICCL